MSGARKGIRTPVLALRGRRPIQLDDASRRCVWRRVKDSNLRAGCPTICFRGSATRPLWDLAVIELVRRAGLEPATSRVETRNSESTELTPRDWYTHLGSNLRVVRAALCRLSYTCACDECG